MNPERMEGQEEVLTEQVPAEEAQVATNEETVQEQESAEEAPAVEAVEAEQAPVQEEAPAAETQTVAVAADPAPAQEPARQEHAAPREVRLYHKGAPRLPKASQSLKVLASDGTPKIIGFFHEYDSEYGCFSNWYSAGFDYAGKHYTNAEQYIMYQKVMTFRKYELGEQILKTDDPARVKKLGSQYFPEFYPMIWDKVSYQILKQGIKEKFRQNQRIQDTLLGTGMAILAECSLKDTRWGIGMDDNDPEWSNVSKWTGRNYLGRILMEVRDELRLEKNLFGKVLAYQDYRDAEPIPQWERTPGELSRIPAYHLPVITYLDTLPDKKGGKSYSFRFSLADIEDMMRMNMGGALPIPGFYEMKQAVYEIAAAQKA